MSSLERSFAMEKIKREIEACTNLDELRKISITLFELCEKQKQAFVAMLDQEFNKDYEC